MTKILIHIPIKVDVTFYKDLNLNLTGIASTFDIALHCGKYT